MLIYKEPEIDFIVRTENVLKLLLKASGATNFIVVSP